MIVALLNQKGGVGKDDIGAAFWPRMGSAGKARHPC